MFTRITQSCLSHTSYVLGAKNICLCETVILSTQIMCCGLVKRKMILHHTILSGGQVNVYSIYLQWKFYKPYIICFGRSKQLSH